MRHSHQYNNLPIIKSYIQLMMAIIYYLSAHLLLLFCIVFVVLDNNFHSDFGVDLLRSDFIFHFHFSIYFHLHIFHIVFLHLHFNFLHMMCGSL